MAHCGFHSLGNSWGYLRIFWHSVGFTLLGERRRIESAVYLLGEATIQLGFLSGFVCCMLFPRCSFLATVFDSGLLMKR